MQGEPFRATPRFSGTHVAPCHPPCELMRRRGGALAARRGTRQRERDVSMFEAHTISSPSLHAQLELAWASGSVERHIEVPGVCPAAAAACAPRCRARRDGDIAAGHAWPLAGAIYAARRRGAPRGPLEGAARNWSTHPGRRAHPLRTVLHELRDGQLMGAARLERGVLGCRAHGTNLGGALETASRKPRAIGSTCCL